MGTEISHLTGDFLGCLVADVVELGSADRCALEDVNLVDDRRVEGEDLLDTYTRSYTADGEGSTSFLAVLTSEYEAFEGLEASFTLLLYLLPNLDGVTRAEVELLPFLYVNW